MNARIRDGGERFRDGARELGATVGEFWRSAYSDLAANSTRALVAEYLVARALGACAHPRLEWDAVDVVVDRVKVEVKCAGYVQTWPQKTESCTHGWLRATSRRVGMPRGSERTVTS